MAESNGVRTDIVSKELFGGDKKRGRRLTDQQCRVLWQVFMAEGHTINEARRRAGVGFAPAKKFLEGDESSSRFDLYQKWSAEFIPEKVVDYDADDESEVHKAANDFAYFRKICLGHDSDPWHVDAAEKAVAAIERGEATQEKQYQVVNAPPGSGKTTLYSQDIPLWLICRNRSVRLLYGSASHNLARRNTQKLRMELMRATPAKGAKTTIAKLFGIFEPDDSSIWTRGEFTVRQAAAEQMINKESTVTAYGRDSEVIGNRMDIMIWDDLVSAKTVRSARQRKDLAEDWDKVIEARLDEGGVLFLIGQRLHPDDIYHHCAEKLMAYTDEDLDRLDAGVDIDAIERQKMYELVSYPAHFEEHCEGDHARKTRTLWHPDGTGGCLLASRLSWRELAGIKDRDPNNYDVVYQQKDGVEQDKLAQQIWIDGGIDEDGQDRVGCWDDERGLCELPKGLKGPLYSYATIDPSPTKRWAIQWWVHDFATGDYYLMDISGGAMAVTGLLDWEHDHSRFVGIMQEWQERSVKLGLKITTWVFEKNAAQAFVTQVDAHKRWKRLHSVTVHEHTTGANKGDIEYGVVVALKGLYRHGKIRLPGRARQTCNQLVQEVVGYPAFRTNDHVMSQWFGVFNLDIITIPEIVEEKSAEPLVPRIATMLGFGKR